MSRFRCRQKIIKPQKYSSLWFALKATQNTRGFGFNNGFIDNEVNQQLFGDKNNSNCDFSDSLDDNQVMDQICNNSSNGSLLSSNSGLNDIQLIQINSKRALLLINKKEFNCELTFGCLRMTLMTDNFNISLNGFKLLPNNSIELMAVFGYKISIKCQSIETNGTQDVNEVELKLQSLGLESKQIELLLSRTEANNWCIILVEKLCLSSLLFMENIPNFKPLNMKSESDWFEFRKTGSSCFLNTHIWDKLFTELNLTKNDVIIVCGGKDVGKSSLIRYLVNRYQSENSNNRDQNEILYFDCDPGQTEFTTPGQIGLTTIDRPVLGPTSANVINFKPLICSSIGVINVSLNPKLYISNICYIMNYISNKLQSKGPLFINTMGWTQDLGLALLIDIIRITQPTHVIQIDSTNDHKKNITLDLSAKSLSRHKGYRSEPLGRNETLDYRLTIIESQLVNSNGSQAKTNRMLTQLSYISRMQNIIFQHISTMTPFKINWSQVYVHVVNDSPIAHELVLDILNLSWVQLCQIDDTEPNSLNINGCDGIRVIGSIFENKCFGCGIVRGIDFKDKSFYIISPESSETMDSINCIVLPFSISIPECIVLDQLKYSCSSDLPYVSDMP